MASSPTVSSARPSCGHATSASRTTSNGPMVPGKLRSQVNVPFCGSIFSPKLPLKIAVVSVCFILPGSFSRNGHVLRPRGTWNGSKKLNLVDCSWIIHRSQLYFVLPNFTDHDIHFNQNFSTKPLEASKPKPNETSFPPTPIQGPHPPRSQHPTSTNLQGSFVGFTVRASAKRLRGIPKDSLKLLQNNLETMEKSQDFG